MNVHSLSNRTLRKNLPGRRVELPTNPEGFRGCSKLLEVKDCQVRVLLCFKLSLDLARFAERTDLLRRRESEVSEPTSRVGMPTSVLRESLLKVDSRSDIVTSGGAL